MPEIYQLILNSQNSLTGSTSTNANYNVDFSSFLPEGKYNVHFSYLGGANIYNGSRLPILYINNLNANNFTSSNGSGAPTTTQLGLLKPIIINGSNNTVYFQAEDNTNYPIFINQRPLNNILNISILDNFGNVYADNAVAGSGTATQAAKVLTIATQTAGTITIGTKITLNATVLTVVSFGTGSGGVGTYNVDTSQTVATAQAYTSPAGNPPAPYILTLAFEKINS